MSARLVARRQELAFRTQYAELKERVLGAGRLLAGTPGSLALRAGSGQPHWYRVFYPFPGKQSEEHVCRDGDRATLEAMRERIELSEWVSRQISALRKLGFQVADKPSARVLVELHNRGAFAAGLVLVGTLSFMAWLNELGVVAVAARTQDIDLARLDPLDLDLPLELLPALQSTGLRFHAVPGWSSKSPPTSAKLPGAHGLRVDVLCAGRHLGKVAALADLGWAGQVVPHFDYLLEEPSDAAVLAGGHCVPVRVPHAGRWVWHKLYSSTQRRAFPEKATKDRQQALTLAVMLADDDPDALTVAAAEAPRAMMAAVRPLSGALAKELAGQKSAAELLRACLSSRR
ncbi:MAG: hypothetical protein L6Q84_09255 [Polyangiaceae bacterium]|nr:hypothetical protein [Polyangiaceae bacterium]